VSNVTVDVRHANSRYVSREYRKSCAVLFILVLFSALPRSWAQMTNVTDVTSTPVPGAGHDYIGVLSETVNPANGAVSLRIQVPIPGGRGLTMPFSFSYDSNGVHFIANGIGGYGIWNLTPAYLSSGGWSYSVPQLTYTLGSRTAGPKLTCPYRTAYVFQDNQAARYAFPMANNLNGGSGCSPSTAVYRTVGQYAADLIADEYFAIDDPDGTVYTFANAGGAGCAQIGGSYTALPSSIEDRNGNLITVSGPPTVCNGSFTVTDTAGRPVLSSSGFGTSGNTLTVDGLSSPYQLDWGTASSSFSVNVSPTFSESESCGGVNAETGTETVLTSLTLPNNQVYKFYYDSVYGLLNKIVYPNGGYVQYDWNVNSLAQDVQFPGSTAAGQGANTCEYHIDSFAVQHRYVSYDGVKVALQQDFLYTTNWVPGSASPSLWSTKVTTVKNTDNIAGTVNTTSYTYSGIVQATAPYISSSAASELPVEQTIAYMDASGATLETVKKTWQDPYALASKTTLLPSGSSSSISYKYGARDQVIEEDDTDYGQSTPTRKILYTYQTFPPVPQFPNVIQASTFSSIVDRPCQIKHEDANANIYAEQNLLYDGGTAVCGAAGKPSVTVVSNLPTGTHDETSYSVSSSTSRGNLTSSTQRCLQSCQDSTTTYAYDETGQATSKIDPCGNATCADLTGSNHKTMYSYTDSPSGGNVYGNSNAYLTSITDPLGHSNTYSYNYSTGEVVGSVDSNKQPTTYNYGTQASQCSQQDLLNRLTEVVYPDGGITEYCYNDSVPSVETAQLLSGSTWKTSVSTMDSLGHVIEAQLTSDLSGADTVTTTYDGGGRVYTKTNPYRFTSDPTYGLTTYAYDALSRPTSVKNPDGSFEYWCYDGIASAGQKNCGSHIAKSTGEWVDFADENGNDWQRTTDSFGRLTSVIEPSGGAAGTGGIPSLETDYSYDILNDLIAVNQIGKSGTDTPRTRAFHYDSETRLTSASNPESGTIGYSYDANGNLSSKTDARSVVVNYKYDVGNRVLSKTYSNDGNKTPSSCFQYDLSSVTNGISRLSSEWTQSASAGACASTPPSTGLWSRRSILTYDAMGRIRSEQQCTPSNCSGGSPYAPTYSYDLEGNTTGSTNGITSTPVVNTLSLTNSFDQAGRQQSVVSNWADSTHPSSLYTAQTASTEACPLSQPYPFSPSGGLLNATFGAGLILNRSYDVRLRTTCETDTGSLLKNATNASAEVTMTGQEQSK
jgi:YD repeat-containing protein